MTPFRPAPDGPPHPVAPKTVALILGAAVSSDGTPSPTFDLRIRRAVDLWRTGRVSAICTTGGRGRFGPPEGQVAHNVALALGLPQRAILVEDRSTNTFENIAFAKALLPDDVTVLIVSNRWHLPRALLIAGLLGLQAEPSGIRGTATLKRSVTATLREVAATPVSVFRAVRWARRTGR